VVREMLVGDRISIVDKTFLVEILVSLVHG